MLGQLFISLPVFRYDIVLQLFVFFEFRYRNVSFVGKPMQLSKRSIIIDLVVTAPAY